MIQKLTRMAVLLLVLGCVSSARAENWYVGAAFTQNDAEFQEAAEEFDADDSAFKIFGGYNFKKLKWLGLEGTYRDFGDFEDNGTSQAVDGELEGIDLNARVLLPLGKFFVIFGKVGYANIQYDLDFSTSNDFDEDEWEMFYGLGVDVNLGKRFGLRGEWEDFNVDDQLSTLSIGGYFRF